MILTTARLTLRPIQIEDAARVFKYRSDAETNRYQGWIPGTLEDVVEFIGKTAKEINTPGTWFQFVIVHKENGNIIGDIGVHFLDDNMQTELGITLSKEHHGKGYACEALTAVIDYIFTTPGKLRERGKPTHERGKHRITASVDPGNLSSIRLFEKLGFRKEAHFVESLFLNGRWVDDVVYALLEREWRD